MTEISGFWTTDDTTPEGDQLTSYSQDYWSVAMRILACCNGMEGVAPGLLNELAGTVGGANTVAIASGCALVDGLWFRNDASQNVNIPSSGVGTTRIDRVLLRADWAGFNVSVYRLEGVESGGTPSAPAITQTHGTTYDITLYQALVNNAGDVTLTDERTWAVSHTDESTLTSSGGNLKVKDAGITYAKLAAGASKVTNRQGGGASAWNTVGTTNYVPTLATIQCGAILSSAADDTTVTFPVSYDGTPLVFVSYVPQIGPSEPLYLIISSTTLANFVFSIYNAADTRVACNCYWLAIGA